MRVWRLCRRPFASDPLGGRGGLLVPARCHPTGTRIVCISATLSLAVLEMLVHTDRDLLPPDLVQMEIGIPGRLCVSRERIASLPPRALQEIGAQWVARRREPVLQVPSAVIPKEHDFLLNPAHRIVRSEPFRLDPRLQGQPRRGSPPPGSPR